MISWATTNPAILAQWRDKELPDAYQLTTGVPGHLEVEALIAEIRRRELDI